MSSIKRRSRPKATPGNMLARQRANRAVELRIAGWSQNQIAADLGVSQKAVSKMLYAELAYVDGTQAERIQTMRSLASARLDALMARYAERAFSGENLDVADSYAKWAVAQARVECVLNQPSTSVHIQNNVAAAGDQSDAHLEATAKFLARLEAPEIIDGDPKDVRTLGPGATDSDREVVADDGETRADTAGLEG